MRHVLTIAACCLIALLSLALVGPWLIDWSSQRQFVEAQLSAALGGPVRTRGAIDLKLLPTPRLELDGVEYSRGEQASFRSGKLRLELAVTPLLRGEFRFLEAVFENAEMDIVIGAPAPKLAAASLPDEVRIERLALVKANLRLRDLASGAKLELAQVDLEAQADSLIGPFKASGSFLRAGERIGFRLNSGVAQSAQLRLKLIIDAGAASPRTDVEGVASLVVDTAATDAAPHVEFDGAGIFSGDAFGGWRATGPLRLDEHAVQLEPLELRFGGEAAASIMTGAARLAIAGDNRVEVSLEAPQLDLDRWRAAQPQAMQTLRALLIGGIGDPNLPARLTEPWSLSLSSPALIAGGETLTGVTFALATSPGRPARLKIAGDGPGRSHLQMEGDLSMVEPARFSGKAEYSARDHARLADWLAGAAPQAASRLRRFPFNALEANGDVAITASQISIENLTARSGRSQFTGEASFAGESGGKRARLAANLKSDALDLDEAPDLTGANAALAGVDLALGLDAHAIRLARFGEGTVDAGRIRVKLSRTNEALKLETLALENLGGANFEAHGEADARTTRINGRIDAQRLLELSALLHRVAPGAATQAFAARAVALSPARATFSLEGAGVEAAASLKMLRLEGVARGTNFEATVRPQGSGQINGLASFDSADAAQLLRQLGFEALQIAGTGRGRISAQFTGGVANGFDATVLAQIAGSQFSFGGAVGGDPASPVLHGQARVLSSDAAPLLRTLAAAAPDLSEKWPVQIDAHVDLAGGKAKLSALTGSFAGTSFTGDLEVAADPAVGARPRVTGSLATEAFSAPKLAALLLGSPPPARAGEIWPQAGFSAASPNLPLADLALSSKTLALFRSITAHDAMWRLVVTPGSVEMNDLTAKLDNAGLSGRIGLRRDSVGATVAATLGVERYEFDTGFAKGVATGQMDFFSTGQPAAALVAGLAGSGAVDVARLELARADPGAPGRLIGLVDTGNVGVAETQFGAALRSELDKASLRVDATHFDATLAGGQLRLGSSNREASNNVVATFDLRNLSAQTRATLAATPLPRDWSGAAPALDVIWKTANLAARDGVRDVDAQAYYNALSVRAIARETARIEALEADIRERAYFVRRQRGVAFLRQRASDIAAFESEQARLEAEAQRRAVEEANRAAAEQARLEKERNERERREAAEALRRETEAQRRANEAAARRIATQPAPAPAPFTPFLVPLKPPVFNLDPAAAGRY